MSCCLSLPQLTFLLEFICEVTINFLNIGNIIVFDICICSPIVIRIYRFYDIIKVIPC